MMKKLLRSKSGLTIEIAIAMIIIVFTLCLTITTTTFTTYKRTKRQAENSNHDFLIDQIGDVFVNVVSKTNGLDINGISGIIDLFGTMGELAEGLQFSEGIQGNNADYLEDLVIQVDKQRYNDANKGNFYIYSMNVWDINDLRKHDPDFTSNENLLETLKDLMIEKKEDDGNKSSLFSIINSLKNKADKLRQSNDIYQKLQSIFTGIRDYSQDEKKAMAQTTPLLIVELEEDDGVYKVLNWSNQEAVNDVSQRTPVVDPLFNLGRVLGALIVAVLAVVAFAIILI